MSAQSVNPPNRDAGDGWQPPRLRETVFWVPFTLIGRHPIVFFLVMLAVIAVGTAYVAALPRAYESRAALLVRIGSSDPTDDLGVFPSDRLYQITVNNEIEAIRTDDVINGIVAQLEPEMQEELFGKPVGPGAGEGLGGKLDQLGETVRGWELPGFPSDEPATVISKADIAEEVRRNLWIELRRSSSVIGLTYNAPSPELAQHMLQLVLNKYQEIRSEFSTSASGLEWLAPMRAERATALTAAEKALTAFIEEHALIGEPAKGIIRLTEQLVELEAERDDLQRQKAGLTRQKEVLEQRLQTWPRYLEEETSEPSEEYRRLSGERNRLKIAVSTGFDEEDQPLSKKRLQELQNAIDKLDEQIAALPEDGTRTLRERDPVFAQLQGKSVDVATELGGVTSKLELLETQLEATNTEIQRLQALQAPYAELDRTRDERQEAYDQLFKPLQRANLAGRVSDTREAGITVIEKPTRPRLPSKPKRKLLLAGIGVLGLFLGLLASFLIEAIRGRPARPSGRLIPQSITEVAPRTGGATSGVRRL
ncbi:MAG: hypothetical protein RL885_25930 [Planctomycetota bacterium]